MMALCATVRTEFAGSRHEPRWYTRRDVKHSAGRARRKQARALVAEALAAMVPLAEELPLADCPLARGCPAMYAYAGGMLPGDFHTIDMVAFHREQHRLEDAGEAFYPYRYRDED